MPGRHVNDHQMRLFMKLRQTHSIAVAAADCTEDRAGDLSCWFAWLLARPLPTDGDFRPGSAARFAHNPLGGV